jgi:hypothetical protein
LDFTGNLKEANGTLNYIWVLLINLIKWKEFCTTVIVNFFFPVQIDNESKMKEDISAKIKGQLKNPRIWYGN